MAITPKGKFEPPYVGSYAVQGWQSAKPVFGVFSPTTGERENAAHDDKLWFASRRPYSKGCSRTLGQIFGLGSRSNHRHGKR